MKKIFFFTIFFLFSSKIFAFSSIDAVIDWKKIKAVEYNISSKTENLKVWISEKWDSLDSILKKWNGIVGANWVFFCPKDYDYCNWENTTNNERYIKWKKIAVQESTKDRVVFAWDDEWKPFLFQSYNINPDKEFDIEYGFSNWPLLLNEWYSMTNSYRDKEWMIFENMKVKWLRNFICSNKDNDKIYFGFVSNSDIDELSSVLYKFWCWNALNLDAGYSTAFINNWKQIYWPWRDILDWVYISNENVNTDELSRYVDELYYEILWDLNNLWLGDFSYSLKETIKYFTNISEEINTRYLIEDSIWLEWKYKAKKIEISNIEDLKYQYLINQLLEKLSSLSNEVDNILVWKNK